MTLPPYSRHPDVSAAPRQKGWEQHVEGQLSGHPRSETHLPEGDPHYEARNRVRDALGSFFSRIGRKLYLTCELPVDYPGEPGFVPDVMAVLDAEPHARLCWAVNIEGKGLDFALEVHVTRERRGDLERNVERYARLGIREYFIFDRGQLRLSGWRLAPGHRTYRPILPQHGAYPSEVLGLSLQVEKERLRFYIGGAPLPEAPELIARLERLVEQTDASRTELEQQLLKETQRREEAERRLAEALAELERLRRERD